MISRASKFPTRIQFLRFRARAKQLSTPHLRIMVLPRVPSGPTGGVGSRLSVVIPIKVSKRATTRNSFKRLVYDGAWKILKDKNLDCIIIFKPIALIKGKVSESLIVSELNGLIV